MAMRVYKPSSKDLFDAAVVAVLLIVINWITDTIKQHTSKYTSKLGEFGGLVVAVVVGLIVATVLTVLGFSKYAALAFALAVGVELAEIVKGHVPKI